MRLTLTIEAIDEHSCRQTLQGHIRVSLFGVGRVVEKIVKDSLVRTYKQLPSIVERWQVCVFVWKMLGRKEGVMQGNHGLAIGSSVTHHLSKQRYQAVLLLSCSGMRNASQVISMHAGV